MLLLTGIFVSLNAMSYSFRVNGVAYNIKSDSTVHVTCITDPSTTYRGDVVVPETVTHDGVTYTVSGVEGGAFKECGNLISVKIPNTVTSLGDGAFAYCDKLERVEMGDGVKSIGSRVFARDVSLKSIHLSAGIESMGEEVFRLCANLEKVDMPEKITAIPKMTFCECSSLKSITIPRYVSEIEVSAFTFCSSLEEMHVDEQNETYESPGDCNAIIEKIGATLVHGCKNTVIPENVRIIGKWAFHGRTNLTSIYLPARVFSIGEEAFIGCNNLESIRVAEDNSWLDSREDCNALIEKKTNTLILGCKNTIFPHGVEKIGDKAFLDCKGLGPVVTFQEGLVAIGDRAFENCDFTEVHFPNTLVSIGANAFWGCKGLTELTFPNSVKTLGISAFAYCDGLQSLTFGNGVSEMYWNTFQFTKNVKKLTIDSEWVLMNMNVSTDSFRHTVEELTIGNSITNVGGENAQGRSLKKVTLGENVKVICDHAFEGCEELVKCDIPEGVTEIGDYAFADGFNAASIWIPKTCTKIGYGAFRNMSGLTSIVVEEGNPVYDSRDNCNAIIETASNTLIKGCATTTLHPTVTKIAYCSFAGCTTLKSIKIHDGITSIGEMAFASCGALETVELGKNVQEISALAFYNDNIKKGLKSVIFHCDAIVGADYEDDHTISFMIGWYVDNIILGDEITKIGKNAFAHVKGMKTLHIGKNVNSIDENAFYDCPGLEFMSITAEVPPVCSENFVAGEAYQTVYLYAPNYSYESAPCWENFYNHLTHNDLNGLKAYVKETYGSVWNDALQTYLNEQTMAIQLSEYPNTAYLIYKEAKQVIDTNIPAHKHQYEWTYDVPHDGRCEAGGFCVQWTVQADHVYDSSIYHDDQNYTCSICGHIDEAIKAEYDARRYMSMTAVGEDMKIGTEMYAAGDESSYVLQYSQDHINWTDYAVADENEEFVTIHKGETCYFRSGMPDVLTSVMLDDKYWNFTMSGTGRIEAGGNVMSLLDRSCQSLTVGSNGFAGLFDHCIQLTVAPELPATELGEGCYAEMFKSCLYLRKAPHLPAKTLGYESYFGMFQDCWALDYVEADFTDFEKKGNKGSFADATYNWLDNTAANGILVLKREMIEKSNPGDVNMPNGWQRALKVKANEDPDHKGNFYTTFYDGKYTFNVTGDAKAYTGHMGHGKLYLKAVPGGIIPQGDGVLIRSNTADVVLPITEEADRVADNDLSGSDTDIHAPAGCYMLSYGQHGLGFYQQATGRLLSAHKAYLVYADSSGVNGLRMEFADGEDDVTSIASPIEETGEGGAIYNLQGIRLNKMQKGINIVGGRKVVK